MIPSVVARQVRETVLDYLQTTFALADPEFERALFEFLNSSEGLFKGPYVDIRLPFRKAEQGERIPLDVRPAFDPYKHQLKAFQRLYSKGGHQPQHTLVTTGTGSGKTECFLYPILDHCLRNHEQPGVKAIILYPMNALASDQARRIAQTLWDDDRLRGKVSAGLYVGGKGSRGTPDQEHLVDDRKVLRASPPDILLTNYKMLDFLLLRPEDRGLWLRNGPDTLRYLVLDELHTYDGAQGSDVACLIRRLKRRLDCARGSLCAVGTSATIGGSMQSQTIAALTDFARKVFDEDFFDDSVVVEDRYDADEALGELRDEERIERFPSAAEMADVATESFEDADAWIRRQAQLWFGEDAGELSPVELGTRLERHDFLRQILRVLGGRIRSLSELSEGLEKREPEWERFDDEQRHQLLESFLALVSRARRDASTDEKPERTEPFLSVQVQLWLRELRRLVRRVAPAGEVAVFAWADELAMRDLDDGQNWLPIVHCRDCGASGLGTFIREGDSTLQTDIKAIGEAWLHRSRNARYLAHGHDDQDEDSVYVCPACLRIGPDKECSCVSGPPTRCLAARLTGGLSDATPPRFLAECPECGTDQALSMLGSRAPSLLSVAISHLYLSDYNADKKLLAFTDSVQDASHRAGFFGARTYRFNLRTAIQGVLEAGDGDVPLVELSERLIERWRRELAYPNLVATLMPDDLRELPSYVAFLEKRGGGKHPQLDQELRDRLSWETTMEYGVGVRVGRTLEQTLCSTVAFDEARIAGAAEILKLELDERGIVEQLPLGGVSVEQLEHFLRGILHRTRVRGGIDHGLLRGYVAEGGNWFFLTKRRQRLISPFSSDSVLPRFLTDRTGTAKKKSAVFDSILSQPTAFTWFRDWAERALAIDRKDAGLNEFYRECMRRLTDAGVLVAHRTAKGNTAWGINPEVLSATRQVGQVVCPHCRRSVTLPAVAVPAWEERACPRYRCPGQLERVAKDASTYYGRIYRSGRLKRIFSSEHTGLLQREERERVEERFKAGDDPDSPNLLVCTPTLEMGIDIGDLSAAMLCSVPPTTSNYLQRIGRAGRSTGNAFCMTVANTRPHDLYFHADPTEMISGQVLPPGCFLDAPEMLKRQLVAHAMDLWARQETTLTSIPGRVSLVLGDAGRESFPGRYLDFYRDNRAEILDSFLGAFGSEISEPNRARLAEFAAGESIPELVDNAFSSIGAERENLRGIQRRAKHRLQEIEAKPDSSDDPESEKKELEITRKLISRLIQELGNKYPLNALTDEGVLPNYAFPEPGVTLESTVSQERADGEREYHAHEYHRPASTAIRELAPFNTFYAEGRRVRIDEIDIGNSANPLIVEWRLCAECSHMERELDATPPAPNCPGCKDPIWADAGQVRKLVHFRRSRSLATRLESATTDQHDDREEAFYNTADLIDAARETWNGARLIPELPFGYELLKKLKLREINFGLDQTADATLRVAGEDAGEKGFELCRDCGRVRKSKPSSDGEETVHHAAYCRARKTGVREKIDSVFLYREIESEAIRVLLPVASRDVDEKKASFKAAIDLGLRRRFQGDPGHLQMRYVREPITGGDGHRHFLVIFDAVPGGTGYLADLWEKDNFLGVLSEALRALQACACQKDPDKDGCYRCLYAYQVQRDLLSISSSTAQEMLTEILHHRDSVVSVDTLSDVSLESKLESELEERFIDTLRDSTVGEDGVDWKERVTGGERRWRYTVGGQQWEIRAQVDLGPAQGVAISTRPDFVISPVGKNSDVLPIAVYCDGFAYHVLPEKPRARIYDDIEKRRAIVASGRYRVFSVTWRDVEDLGNSVADGQLPLGVAEFVALRRQVESLAIALRAETAALRSMSMLRAYLANPDGGEWEKLAGAYAFAALAAGPQISVDQADDLENRLEGEPVAFLPGPFDTVDPKTVPVLSRPYWDKFGASIIRCPAPLAQGQFDDVRVTVRLFDRVEDRQQQGYEATWRRFLHAWNLLQFLPRAEFHSSELIETLGSSYAAATSRGLDARSKAAETPASGAPEGSDTELSECLRYATERSKPLIQAVRAAGLALPDLEYELEAPGDECGPEPDLAWPDLHIAILAPRQLEDRDAFEAAGWTVLEQSIGTEELVAALRAAA